MKKSILNIGKALNKLEQKNINGGNAVGFCNNDGDCPSGTYCKDYFCFKPGSGNGNPGNNDDCDPIRFCLDEFDTCCIG